MSPVLPSCPNRPQCEALARAVMADQVYHERVTEPVTVDRVRQLLRSPEVRNGATNDFMLALRLVRAVEADHGIFERQENVNG